MAHVTDPKSGLHEAAVQEALNMISEIPAIQPLLNVICRKTGLGFAAVAIVTDTRWVAAAVQDDIGFGLRPGGELKLDTTICNEIRHHGQNVVIDHVAEHPDFCNHHTPRRYGFQSYISVPIRLKNGHFFGTLCAIDPAPHTVTTPETISMFELYADLIAFYIASATQVKEAEARLLEEQQNTEVRELFVAMLGHDLRNPLTATINAGKLIQRMTTDKGITDMARIVQNSSYRMRLLIDNLMEYSRSRVGPGWVANICVQPDLEQKLKHTVEELEMNWQGRAIIAAYNLPAPVVCDAGLICQVASNLVTNALVHGDKAKNIEFNAASDDNGFSLTVINQGPAIPENALQDIFKPFKQSGKDSDKRKGLGLGLHIVSEIARLHNGKVEVESDHTGTTFSFYIPLAPYKAE